MTEQATTHHTYLDRMINLTATELRQLLAPVLPFASTDDNLPTLTGIHITTHGGHVIAQATDRYRIAINRVRPTSGAPLPDVDVLIPGAQAKRLVQLARPEPRAIGTPHETLVTITLPTGPDDYTVTIATDSTEGGTVVTFDRLDGTYPNLTGLVLRRLARPADGETARFDPKHLASFVKACDTYKEPEVKVHQAGALEPLVGYVGDNFVGMVMPQPVPDTAPDHATDWATFLGGTA